MSRRFKIEREYYEDGMLLYKKQHATFEPGLTVLIGCNGCGKTTLIKQIKREVQDKLKLPCVYYDNVNKGGKSSMSEALFFNDMSFAASMFSASEGEGIALNLQKVAAQIGYMFKSYSNSEEYWILLDAIDSGLSVDAVTDVKEYLFKTVFEEFTDKNIYIIVSANEYEMARGEKCYDTVNCRYVNVKTYERYRNIVLKSRNFKDERDRKAAEYKQKEDNYDKGYD